MKTEPIELVVVRDPDGGTDVHTFYRGVPVSHTEYIVDAGAGYSTEDWEEARAAYLAQASSEVVRAAVAEAMTDPPGAEYISEW